MWRPQMLLPEESALEDVGVVVQGYNRQGTALQGLGQIGEAITAFKKGLEIDPENAALKQVVLHMQVFMWFVRGRVSAEVHVS